MEYWSIGVVEGWSGGVVGGMEGWMEWWRGGVVEWLEWLECWNRHLKVVDQISMTPILHHSSVLLHHSSVLLQLSVLLLRFGFFWRVPYFWVAGGDEVVRAELGDGAFSGGGLAAVG